MKTSASANARHTVQFCEKSVFYVLIMPKLSKEQRIRLVRLYYANNSSPEELSVESINLTVIRSLLRAFDWCATLKTLELGVWIGAIQSKGWTSKSTNFETKPNKIAMSHLVYLPIFRSKSCIFIEIFAKNFLSYFWITLYYGRLGGQTSGSRA